jgi:DNA-binding LacI/PurR family transcriptional regulator
VRVIPGEFEEAAGAGAADALLRDGRLPTAVFAANDLVALGLIDRLHKEGVEVPRDVSVVGFDNTFVAELSHIRLTTVNQPRHEMGREALVLVLERADGRTRGATRLHRPELVVRASTAPPR